MRTRAGRRATSKGREARRAHIGANWPVLVALSVLATLFAATYTWLMTMWHGRDVGLFSAGAATTAILMTLWQFANTPTTRAWFDGAEGERLTAAAVGWLRLRRWGAVHHVEFACEDVDHVVAGPGGVFSVETKWTNFDWNLTSDGFVNQRGVDATRQAQRSAQRTSQLLRGNYRIDVDVRPVLAIWGPGRPRIDEPIELGGVMVVAGEQLRRLLRGTPERAVDYRSVVNAVRDFTKIRDAHDRRCADRRSCFCP